MDDARIFSLVDRIRREWIAAHILAGLFAFAAAALGSAFILVLLARHLPFSPRILWALRTCWGAAALLALIVLVVRRFFANPSDEQVALLVEAARPELHNELINAVRFAEDAGGSSDLFVRAAIRESARTAEGLRTCGVVNWRPARRSAIAMLLFAAAWCGLFLLDARGARNALAHLARPHANLARIGRVAILEVLPGDVTVVQGDPLTVEVLLGASDVSAIDVRLVHAVDDGAPRSEAMHVRDDGRYECTLVDIREPRTYHVAAENGRSRAYRISVTERPVVTQVVAECKMPAYTGLAPQTLRDAAGVFRVPAGARVRLSIVANKRLSLAQVALGDAPPVALSLEAGHTAATMLRPIEITQTLAGTLIIEDEFGCRSTRTIQIQAVPDALPDVRITAPGQDRTLVVGGVLDLSIVGKDDYGIVLAELVQRRIESSTGNEAGPKVIAAWHEFSDPHQVVAGHRWVFEETAYRNGETIEYWVRMRDGNPATGRGVGLCRRYKVRLEDIVERREQREEKYNAWQEELRRILADQRKLRQETNTLGGEKTQE